MQFFKVETRADVSQATLVCKDETLSLNQNLMRLFSRALCHTELPLHILVMSALLLMSPVDRDGNAAMLYAHFPTVLQSKFFVFATTQSSSNVAAGREHADASSLS